MYLICMDPDEMVGMVGIVDRDATVGIVATVDMSEIVALMVLEVAVQLYLATGASFRSLAFFI
ncbi:hypothetical protein NQ317_007926 [Molorchus minor]|uniref:NADH dehydrogenase subunit 4L n=1 Tax=Molorchus minor TaxID=1323400 RepID=A0ABQ9IPQ0_9CUCU|nr:hypothetical protein NQ317_007926 [Molorchus minor]